MMNILEAGSIMRLSLGLLLIWAIFYISFRRFLLDNLRQRLFQIRDDVFDFAADGGIAFDDPCYRDLREDINSLLLFANKLSFARVLFAQLSLKQNPALVRQVERSVAELDRLPPLQRKKLSEARVKAWREMILYVIRRSVILYVLFVGLSAVSLWIGAARALYQRLPDLAKPLEAQARDEHRLAA